MTICYARPERHDPHTIRCAVCRLAWDIDDPIAPSCPKQVTVACPPAPPLAPERLPFASGLPFVDFQHKR
jgi:hypothetical protein